MKKLRGLFLRASPEWVVTTVLLMIVAALLAYLHAPLRWPCLTSLVEGVLAFVVGYILIVFVVGLWMVAPSLIHGKEDQTAIVRRVGQELGNGFCFGIVLTLTFCLKLWEPLIRSVSYDRVYEAVDRTCLFWLQPFISWRAHHLQFNWVNQLYDAAFVGMFLVSLVVHLARGRAEFRRVFLASLLVQAAGGCLYLIAPASGPFLYHPSANRALATVQHTFSEIRHQELLGGVEWLRLNTGRYITCGLGAMPSLHAAASFVFLYYAWRHVRWLGIIYTPVFAWILLEAMASRWHYGIDLVAGVMMAYACIALTEVWLRTHDQARRAAIMAVSTGRVVSVAE